ncbi:MAG: glycosyltransferase [Gemmatimonadota bacterium]
MSESSPPSSSSLAPVGRLGLRLSVIVTTYNNPRALSLVLACLARQTLPEFELLVADDGSGDPTRSLIEGFARRVPFPVRHVWHPDAGFQKCAILNKAILAAAGDYLIFFDGDVLAPSRCIERHVRAARRGTYLAGGKIDLLEPMASRITERDIEGGILERVGSWWRHLNKPRRFLASYVPGVRDWLDGWVPREPSWRGENSSAFKEDLLRVDGFDERFTHGFDDADFGHRLQAAGVHGRSIRYTCPVFHLDHPRPYSNHEQISANKALYDQNRLTGVVGTDFGIRKGTHQQRV